MRLDELTRLHNAVKPQKKWMASSWSDKPGVWTEEGPFVGKHIVDCDQETAEYIACMRNHFDEFINLVKVAKNYKEDAMNYARTAIRMVKKEINREEYNKYYMAMQNSEEIFQNQIRRIEDIR